MGLIVLKDQVKTGIIDMKTKPQYNFHVNTFEVYTNYIFIRG